MATPLLWTQADGWSVGAIYMANRGSVFNNSVGCVNLVRWLHGETFQRRSLCASRYTFLITEVQI